MVSAATIAYVWPAFRLEQRQGGGVYTVYADGQSTGCEPHKDDEWHGTRLGIPASAHRLLHELGHTLVGLAYYRTDYGSPVLWRSAHDELQPQPDADLEEWLVTSLCYHACGLDADPAAVDVVGALIDLRRANCDPDEMGERLLWMLDAPRYVSRLEMQL